MWYDHYGQLFKQTVHKLYTCVYVKVTQNSNIINFAVTRIMIRIRIGVLVSTIFIFCSTVKVFWTYSSLWGLKRVFVIITAHMTHPIDVSWSSCSLGNGTQDFKFPFLHITICHFCGLACTLNNCPIIPLSTYYPQPWTFHSPCSQLQHTILWGFPLVSLSYYEVTL
jgi:hypothetical protein